MKTHRKQYHTILSLVLRTIAVNKKRCFFAVLGIIIGICAVTTMASLGYSSQEQLEYELKKLGTNMLIIESGIVLPNRSRRIIEVDTMTEKDIPLIQNGVDGINAIAPVFLRAGIVRNEEIPVITTVIATRTPFMQISALDISEGRFFSDEDDNQAQQVILLGQTVASLLFKNTDPIGQTVILNNTDLKVIGILEEKGLDANNEDLDNLVIVPLTTAKKFGILDIKEYLTHIYIEVQQAEIIPKVKEEIKPILRAAHNLNPNEPDDFNIIDQSQLLAAQMDILGSVRNLINVLAIITLFGGGLGITAVQLISIRERVWEIGLHRALGASQKDIAIQFIFESAILGAIGGFVGATVGVIAPLTIALALSFTPIIAWSVLFLSLFISVLIGIVAGIYPAFFASRLDPVVALRS